MTGLGDLSGRPSYPMPPPASDAPEIERLRYDLNRANRRAVGWKDDCERAERKLRIAYAALLFVAAFGLGFSAGSCHEPNLADAEVAREVRS